MKKPLVLAVDIGGTQFSLALAEPDGRVVRRSVGATDRTGGAQWMIASLLEKARGLIKASGGRVKACGIGFGGPVDFAGQRVLSSTHVAGWEDLGLSTLIEQELHIPAIVENDANVGALGEYVFGVGQGSRYMVYYTISTGIGGGIIIDGQIYRGGDGNAGEFGHGPILVDGPLCDCGNRGCLESLCSGKSIGDRAQEAVAMHSRKGAVLRGMAGPGNAITARIVFTAARAGDKLAQEIVEQTCEFLGMSMATTMNSLAPDMIVVGGGVSKAGKVLLNPLVVQTRRFLMPVHRPHLKIRLARFSSRSVIMGAVALGRSLL
ncbi:MAG: glucokinase [Candidatus Latescibacterota bacterium]|jgi:glucokinase